MQQADILALANLRVDGRRCQELRQLKYKIGLSSGAAAGCSSSGADGSCYLEQGLNKVVALVHGPCEPPAQGTRPMGDKGSVSVSIIHSPFSGIDHKPRRQVDRRNQEAEKILKQTLEGVLLLELYPRSHIEVVVHVMAVDGSVACTMQNAVTMALMDAGVAMSDMVVSCSTGFVNNQACVDLTQLEQSSGVCLPLAVKARSEEVLYLQLDSRLSQGQLREALDNGLGACRQLRILFESAMKKHMTP